MATFEEELNRTGHLIYSNVGDSMLPLIRQGRDLLVIEKTHGARLNKYDIPLYKRDTGQYVLHRILKVRDNDYVICGDNRYSKEYGITDRHIIGVLTSVVRDGKELDFRGFGYRAYVFLWCGLFPVRAFVLRVKHYLKRLFKE